MQLQKLKEIFEAIEPNTYHYQADGAEGNYNVWAEDGQAGASHADNKMQIQVLEGTLDRFTLDEFDPMIDRIQQGLNDAGLTWSLNSIQYEQQTGYIHYEWVWQIENPIGGVI